MQKDYKAYSGDVFASIPVAKGDEVGGQVQWIHYDGGTFLTTIPKQDDVLVEAAYYLSAAKVQPFLKYESQKFAYDVDKAKDQDRFGGGLNWYVSAQNFKITAQYLRVEPKSSTAEGRRTSSRSSSRASTSDLPRAAPWGMILAAPLSMPRPGAPYDDRHGARSRSPGRQPPGSRRAGSGPPSSGSRPRERVLDRPARTGSPSPPMRASTG